MNKIYSVLKILPDNNQKCMALGHKTYCCKEDMDEFKEWHEVTFEMDITEYKLKNELPEDPEDTVLEYYKVKETWTVNCKENECDYGAKYHVIGVTEWKNI